MKRFLVSFLLFILVSAAALGGLAAYGWQLFIKPGPSSEDTILVLEKGSGLSKIARDLEAAGIIHNKFAFSFGVRVRAQEKNLKAGEYLFTRGMPGEEVMNLLVTGKIVAYSLTIPEGLQSREIRALILSDKVLSGDISEPMPEGSMLPETYRFNRGASRDQLVRRLKKALVTAVDRLWQKRPSDSLINTKKDLIILASIVEKETGLAAERARVAAVFLNRLRLGMRLQSDPTVIYGVTGGKYELKRGLTRKDLRAVNDYNTYVISGLPVGPISNPGLDSLKAVLKPAQSKDLYFVASGTGGHLFAKTLAEHNRNVRKWRKLQKKKTRK